MSITDFQQVCEDWILDRFVPWFIYISHLVGIVTIYFLISLTIHNYLDWDGANIFVALLILGLLLPPQLEKNRLKREINILIEDEIENIKKIVKDDNNTIDYPVLENIISRITKCIRDDGYEDSKENSIYQSVKKAVWNKYRTISK